MRKDTDHAPGYNVNADVNRRPLTTGDVKSMLRPKWRIARSTRRMRRNQRRLGR